MPPLSEGEKQAAFTARVLGWFADNARAFPWRAATTPYEIAVAEALLQKTAAVNVVPVFEVFIRAYPTVAHLAAAQIEEVRELLRPLGLPRRGELLLQLARDVVAQHGGEFPRTEAELRRLPGVGPYGAGAIAALAFGQRAPMIDINVMRVLNRVFSFPVAPRNAPPRRLREFTLSLSPPGREVEFNLAMLDFAALICRARDPRHALCPLRNICDYHQAVQQAEIEAGLQLADGNSTSETQAATGTKKSRQRTRRSEK